MCYSAMAEEMAKIKKQRAADRKAFRRLSEKEQNMVVEKRMRKEVKTFLLPDAPPLKFQ